MGDIRARLVYPPCRLCGGSGYIRYADVYKPHCGDAVVCWDLSRVVRCGCREAR